ncbi:MAG: hypothetical protein R3343_13080 [Nitriliruptorales bacterium]|nr:hypothetical protein [Nitriliruptorales bacterium]
MRKTLVTIALGALMALGTAAPALAHSHTDAPGFGLACVIADDILGYQC